MFKKLFKRFAKKTETKIPDGVRRVEVNRVEINRSKINRIELDENSTLITKFRDTTTGEIVKVAFNDHEKFNECMSNKNMQLIFG
jgi:hypothetical protein